MRPLSRRALFALPVALPVAAVAAKVAPVNPFATGGVVGPARFARIIGEGEPEVMVPIRIRIDAEEIRHFARVEAQRIVSRPDPAAIRMSYRMNAREGAADAATPVTVQAAAPVGEQSCGGVESGHASALPESNMADDSRDPMLRRVGSEQSPSSTRALPPGGEASPQQGLAGVAPGPHDTSAQPAVA